MQMLPGETLDQFVARINASAYIPPPEPTGAIQMASKVKLSKGKEFHFPTAAAGAVQSKYDWDGWFSGDLLMLERSSGPENDKGTIEVPTEKRDYEVPTDAMPPKIKTAARRRYKVCQISRVGPDGSRLKDAIIIQARDMTAEERQAEDELRATEKAEAKAKKDANKAGDGASPPDSQQVA